MRIALILLSALVVLAFVEQASAGPKKGAKFRSGARSGRGLDRLNAVSVNGSIIFSKVIFGYYDYLGTRPKNSHRPIIVTGQ